jgi:hypothetical protein
MRIKTTSLDRLTVEAKDGMLAAVRSKHSGLRASSETINFIAGSRAARVHELIIKLFQVFKTTDLGEADGPLRTIAKEAWVDKAVIDEFFELIRNIAETCDAIAIDRLVNYSDLEVAAVLLDLYRVNEDEFDAQDPANVLDYNREDGMPKCSENPHTYLVDLISDAVTARVVKKDGRELLLTWMDSSRSAE